MAGADTAIRVEVVYVSPTAVHVASVNLTPGASVRDAINQSKLLRQCPEINLAGNRVGIFGRLCPLEAIPADGDRIEIYRRLLTDPKEARRRRATV